MKGTIRIVGFLVALSATEQEARQVDAHRISSSAVVFSMRATSLVFALTFALICCLPLHSATAPSTSAVIIERTGCLGDCPEYEVDIRANGRVVWRGRGNVARKGVAFEHIDPFVALHIINKYFANSPLQTCYYTEGIDAPGYYLLFTPTGDFAALRKERDEQFRRENEMAGEMPCKLEDQAEAMAEFERAVNSHRWLHGAESITDYGKWGDDVYFDIKPGFNKLMAAAARGEAQATASLLETTPVDSVDETGWTPLMLAAAGCQLEVISMLLAKGADPRHADRNGDTALFAAANSHCMNAGALEPQEARTKLAKLLLTAGADPSFVNRRGQTPIMIAAREGNDEAVQALLAAGAHALAKDQKGLTADQYAIRELAKVVRARRPDDSFRQDFTERLEKVRKYLAAAKR